LALKAAKHILCEKPAAVNLSLLNEVLEVAKSRRLLFMEGMQIPFTVTFPQFTENLAFFAKSFNCTY
jgi:predicted dehydrogenase